MMLTLFDRVVRETGLVQLIARGIVVRACIRAGVRNPESMAKADLEKVLPNIETMLGLYLNPEEVRLRMERLKKMSCLSGPYVFHLEDSRLDE